jgi:hypothetical protein
MTAAAAGRPQVTQAEAEEIFDGIRGGSLRDVSDLTFPADAPLDIGVLRDMGFRNCHRAN